MDNQTQQVTALVAAGPSEDVGPTTIQLRRAAKLRLFEPQRLMDEKFMSRSQREAFLKGEEIWV
jgi:hypothetical protein